MRSSRIAFAALAALSILIAPAEARSYRAAQSGAAHIDVAAIPPYPTASDENTPRAPRQSYRHWRRDHRMTLRSHQAATASPEPREAERGPGIVRSSKTGATAHVAASFAPVAQAVVDDLEQNYGARIKFMGGYRPGPCASWSLHPCGLAIDLCQLSRGVVDRRCNMPSRAIEERVARAHGGYSGGEWCNNDRGHIQAKETAGRCGHNLYAAVTDYKATIKVLARHRYGHHQRIRYARQ